MDGIIFLQKEIENQSIPTGCKRLDQGLCNGIPLGHITEIAGNSGSGKTQLCLQITFNSIIRAGNTAGHVLWISSRRNLHPQRLNEMAESCVKSWKLLQPAEVESTFTKDDVLRRIIIKQISGLNDLIAVAYWAYKFIKKKRNIRLVVIDSFSAYLRDLDFSDNARIIHELFLVLQRTAEENSCAVVLTNDLTPRILPECEMRLKKPALSENFHHRCAQRILLLKLQNSNITGAQVQKSLWHGKSLSHFTITDEGIKDVKDE